MKGNAVSPRYAKVMFDLDRERGNLDQRLTDFESIANILKQNSKLVKFLKSPQIPLDDKKKLLQDSLKAGFDQAFINFIVYLIQKGRITNLSNIGKDYRLLVNEHLNRWDADIVTAVPMDSDSEAKLVKKLELIFQKKINLNKKIDPNIIGGAILVMSNEMLDWSVKGRLRKLKDKLIATSLGAQ